MPSLLVNSIRAGYTPDLHEFISMLGDEELARQDFSVISVHQLRERKKVEAVKASVFIIRTNEVIPEVKLYILALCASF